MTEKPNTNPFYATRLLGIEEVSLPRLSTLNPVFANTVLHTFKLPALKALSKSVIAKLRNIKWSKTTYKTVKRFSAKRNR